MIGSRNAPTALAGTRQEQQLGLIMARGPDNSFRDAREMLRKFGLKATYQRIVLGSLLFSGEDRHVTAETLFEEAKTRYRPMSLATVYNTLNQFTEAGLLRRIGVDGSRSFFDTNPSEHHHFFLESEEMLVDIPDTDAILEQLPAIPDGYCVTHVAVVVRLRRLPG